MGQGDARIRREHDQERTEGDPGRTAAAESVFSSRWGISRRKLNLFCFFWARCFGILFFIKFLVPLNVLYIGRMHGIDPWKPGEVASVERYDSRNAVGSHDGDKPGIVNPNAHDGVIDNQLAP